MRKQAEQRARADGEDETDADPEQDDASVEARVQRPPTYQRVGEELQGYPELGQNSSPEIRVPGSQYSNPKPAAIQ